MNRPTALHTVAALTSIQSCLLLCHTALIIYAINMLSILLSVPSIGFISSRRLSQTKYSLAAAIIEELARSLRTKQLSMSPSSLSGHPLHGVVTDRDKSVSAVWSGQIPTDAHSVPCRVITTSIPTPGGSSFLGPRKKIAPPIRWSNFGRLFDT